MLEISLQLQSVIYEQKFAWKVVLNLPISTIHLLYHELYELTLSFIFIC